MKFLNLAPDETTVEWVVSMILILIAIITVAIIGPDNPSCPEPHKVEVINEH